MHFPILNVTVIVNVCINYARKLIYSSEMYLRYSIQLCRHLLLRIYIFDHNLPYSNLPNAI